MRKGSPWHRGPLTRNPYYHTAFHVLRMSPAVTRRHAVRQHVLQARNLAAAMPEAHQIRGCPVSESEINEAGEVLSDGRRRLWEELLAHRPEDYLTPRLRRLRERLRSCAPQGAAPEGPAPVRRLTLLAHWMKHLLSERAGETAEEDLMRQEAYRPIPPCGGGG